MALVAGVVRERPAPCWMAGGRVLRGVLSDPSAMVIVVGTGTGWCAWAWDTWARRGAAQGRRVLVAVPGETADELVGDMMEVLTWMCACLYGRGGARNRALRAVTAAKMAGVHGAAA